MPKPTIAKPALFLLAGFIAGGGLTAAHVYVARQGLDYSGPLLLFDHLFVLATVLLLVAICTAVGRLLLRRFVAELGPLDGLLFAAALGAGAVALAILILGFLGGIHPVAVVLLPLLLGLVAQREMRELPRLCSQAARYLRQEAGDRVIWIFGLAVFGAAVSFMLLYALGPPVDWDSLMYHVRVPAQFLERGRIYFPADNVHVAYVGVLHMLYLPLLALSSPAGPATLGVVLAALLGFAVFAFAARFLGSKTASLSLALVWGTTTILLVAMSPRVDVSLTLYLFLAHYALLIALTQPERHDLFYLAAILLGLAVGVKFSALPYVAALGPLVVWVTFRRTRSAAGSLGPLIVFGVYFLAAVVPWLAKNWLLLGAPLYPYFSERLLEPWMSPLFGGMTWPANVDPRVIDFIWDVRAPFNLSDAFFAPGRLTIEAEGSYYYLNPALLLLPLWLLFVRNKTLSWLVAPLAIFLLIILVILPSPNLRYLIPAAVPLTIVAAHMMVTLSERFLSSETARVLLVALTSLALVPSAIMARDWLTQIRAADHFVGTASAEDYMRNWLGPGYLQLVRMANGELAADSRILMLFDARGYYFEPEVLQDNLSTNWPLVASVLDEHDCLESLGVTHVLLGLGSLRYYVTGGLDLERVRWSAFQRFAGRCLEPVFQDFALVLFRVRQQEERTEGSAQPEGD
jgi:hypothetical protein